MPKYAAATFGLLVGLAASPPAEAFWQRSQWSRCSDATSADEWNRYRCWQLNPYHDGAASQGFGEGDGIYGMRRGAVRGRMAPGGTVVRRLG
jgi:hypothetical protein